MEARLLCVVVLAKNYDRLIRWYRKTFRMKTRMVVTEGFDWTELERPGLRIGFAPAKQQGVKLGRRRSNAVVIHLTTPNVRGLFKRVKRAGGGVRFGPSYDPKGKYWCGSFTDIEGNEIWVIDLAQES